MIPPNYIYSTALMVAGLICLLTGLLVVQTRRNALGAIPLTILMFSLSWWDITYSLFWAKAPAPFPNFWLYITYIGAMTVPEALLTFAMQLSGLKDWLRWPFITALCAEPIAVIALLFTDPWHGLFFGGKDTHNIGMIMASGPVYWANIIFSYILVLVSCILLVRRFLRISGIYRWQLGVILIGIAIPWINSFIFIFGLSPFPNADNTPLSFSISGLAFAYALLRYRLLDIIPIARHVLIESMNDGVMVLDVHNRLVDINPAAQQVIDPSGKSWIGKSVEKAFSAWSEVVDAFHDVKEAHVEVPLGNPPRNYLDLKISPLHDAHHNFIGHLVVWRDITPLKEAQSELQELAAKDVLTNAFNRRHFLNVLNKEIHRADRFDHPLTIILLDFDHLKHINDTFGHLAGDDALKTFADICHKNIREVDLLARFGGDEFVVLLPEADLGQARLIAERMSQGLAQSPFEVGAGKILLTVSMGIATVLSDRDTVETLMHRADQALYAAKESGRNCIVVWDESLLTLKN